MTKIAILGPENTFTDLAAEKYSRIINKELDKNYYSTIRKTYEAVCNDCELGILPIENTLDGYVQITLDLLAKGDLKIIHEVILPIDFLFISKKDKNKKIKNLFVQFKTHNQCLDFIEKLDEVNVITTESNGASYREFLENAECDAAIIPSHMLDNRATYKYRVDNVADSIENETRFVILNPYDNNELTGDKAWKSSFVISNENDRPGLLSEVLNCFAKNNINLLSIISRPTKKELGKYNFFIDIEGCYTKDERVRDSIEEVMKNNHIKILGSFYNVEKFER